MTSEPDADPAVGASAPRRTDADIDAARALGASSRRGVSGPARTAATARAVGHLLALPELTRVGPRGVVAATVAVRYELDVGAALEELRRRGWSIALPAVLSDRSMVFRIVDPDSALERDAMGIPAPPARGADLYARDLDVVIAPFVAADAAGTRVGHGAGCYDRALADRQDRPFVIAAGFDVQVVTGTLPARPWDVPADVVVTDQRTIRPSATAGRPGPGPADGGSADAPAR